MKQHPRDVCARIETNDTRLQIQICHAAQIWSRSNLGMPPSKNDPPARKNSSITSFFQRIDRAHQSFQNRGEEQSLSSRERGRPRSSTRSGPNEQRERAPSLSTIPTIQSEAPNNGGSLLETILREPFRSDQSIIPQRRAYDVLAEPIRTNDGLSAVPMESSSDISTGTATATAAAKRPRRALTSSFTTGDGSSTRAAPKKKRSRNVVHALANRSLTGKLRSALSPVSWRRKMNWCHASKIRISHQTPNSRNTVTALAFDYEGSLLAVGYGRAELSIYDWQSIRLSTLRSTREKRNKGCSPILQFKVGPFSVPIALLAWNPFNEDEIAVGLRATGSVFILDLQVVQGWLEDQPPYGSASMPPCSELRCFETGPRDLPWNIGGAVMNQNSSFVFVDGGRVALLSAGATVFCWRLPAAGAGFGIRRTPTWTFQHHEMISAMVILSSKTVVLGGDKGSITILNWEKTQSNAFSAKPTPTVHARFNSNTGKTHSSFHTIRLMVASQLVGDFFRLTCLPQRGKVVTLIVDLQPKSDTVFDSPRLRGNELVNVDACGSVNNCAMIWKASELLCNNGVVETSESRASFDDRILRPTEQSQTPYTRGRSWLTHWASAGNITVQSFDTEIGRGKPIAVHPSSEFLVAVDVDFNNLVVLRDIV